MVFLSPLFGTTLEHSVATFLYRLGRFSYRRRWVVLLSWLALFVLAGVGAATLSGTTSDSFSIPDTESQEAFDLLAERFPEAEADGASARVVFAAPEGESLTDPENQAHIADVIAEVTASEQVAQVGDPFQTGTVSPDGQVAFAQVTYDVPFADLTDASKDDLAEAAEAGRDNGLTVELGGEAVQQTGPEGASSEAIGLAVAAVVLVVTFGSLIAAGLPLLTAIVGIGIGISAITTATGFIDIGSNTSTLAMMLGLAVAIDYALFIVSRYRHELTKGGDGEEAAGRAVGTAGSAVVFAGLTVMIALSGLGVVGIPMLTEMGLAAAFTVGISVLIALTLLPALLGFAKHRILGGRIPGLRARDPEAAGAKPGIGARWAGFVTRRPAMVLVVAILGLVGLAAPVTDLHLGLPDEGSMGPDTTQRKAYDLISEGFGPGFNGPLMVVVDGAEAADTQGAAEQVASTIDGLDGVASVSPPMLNQAGDAAMLNVVPEGSPSSIETENLVADIRDASTGVEFDTGTAVAVTGTTAINIDFSEKMADALVPYLAVVVGLSLLLLMLVFRSILVPIKAALGFLLTMGATFGVLVAIFQWGWLNDLLGVEQTGPIISMLPIFLIGVVFGLAMDYQVFLVTRMREEYVHGAEPTPAVVTGFQHGSRVVTAAAIIMISVFSGFVFAGDDFIMQIGLAMAAAVAFDAFIVRMTIVPAVLALVGRAAWWLPKWLDRALPNVDVEGEKLRKMLAEREEPERELETAASR